MKGCYRIFVPLIIGGSQNNDRNVGTCAADPYVFQHLHSGSFRKIEIKDHEVGTGLFSIINVIDEPDRSFTISDDGYVALNLIALECFPNETDVPRVVLNQQNLRS